LEYIAKKVVLGSLTQKEVESAQLEVLFYPYSND